MISFGTRRGLGSALGSIPGTDEWMREKADVLYGRFVQNWINDDNTQGLVADQMAIKIHERLPGIARDLGDRSLSYLREHRGELQAEVSGFDFGAAVPFKYKLLLGVAVAASLGSFWLIWTGRARRA